MFATLLCFASSACPDNKRESLVNPEQCDHSRPSSQYAISQNEQSAFVPLYRYRRYAFNIDHFYATDTSVIGTCKIGESGTSDFTFQRIECIIATGPSSNSNLIPIHQYWSRLHNDHLYTTNTSEVGTTQPGEAGLYDYRYQGIVGYCSPTKEPGTVALYRYWNLLRTDHLYTTQKDNDADVLRLRNAQFQFRYHLEGILCYAYQYQALIGYLY